MDFIVEWWKQIIGCGFVIAGAGAIAWINNKFVSRKEHQQLAERVTIVEAVIEELPGTDDIHELEKRLIEVSGKLDSISPQLDSLQRVTGLLMENELRGNRND